MNYNIVYPFRANIMGPSHNEAVKNFIKQNDLLWKESKHMSLIIQDMNNKNNYESKVRFYTEEGRNKVGITSIQIPNTITFPLAPPFGYPIQPFVYSQPLIQPMGYPYPRPMIVPPSMPMKMSNVIVPNEYSMRIPIAYTQNIGPYFSMQSN